MKIKWLKLAKNSQRIISNKLLSEQRTQSE